MPDCNECLKEIAESLPESAEKLGTYRSDNSWHVSQHFYLICVFFDLKAGKDPRECHPEIIWTCGLFPTPYIYSFLSGDMEIQLLKQRLLETERAMAQIVAQMGNMQEITKVATAMAASASTPAPDENSGGDNEKV